MPLVSLPYVFSSGTTIIASQTNSNNTVFLNLLNGGLDNLNLTGTAGITGANLNLSSPGAIGGTTPSTGAFSTLNVGTTHQGDILYDNGTSLVRLTPGTNGQYLQTQGTSANPQWTSIPHVQFFTVSGTFTPTFTGNVYLTMVGGGAAGSSSNAGGGGGGGSVINFPFSVTVNTGYTVTVGGGGSPSGGSGGSSSFSSISVAGGSVTTGGGGLNASGNTGGGYAIQGGNGAASSGAGGGTPFGVGGAGGGGTGTGYGSGGGASNGGGGGGAGQPGMVLVQW